MLWFDAVSNPFNSRNLVEMKGAPCVFHKNKLVICHLEDLLMFAKSGKDIGSFTEVFEKQFVVND